MEKSVYTKANISYELRVAIFKDMPKDNSLLNIAIYIYIKLCKMLSYDEEFYATNQKGEIAAYHENIDRISEITPDNNIIVCYEFATIYMLLLQEVGIDAKVVRIDGNQTEYGKKHTYVQFTIDDEIYFADSTLSVFTGDLFGAKLNLPIHGITFADGTPLDINVYNNQAYREMKFDVIDNGEDDPDHIDNAFETFDRLTKNKKEIPLRERIDTLIKKANNSSLKGFDLIIYLNYLLHFLIPVRESFDVKMYFTRDNTTEKVSAKAIIQIFDETIEDYRYYMYGSDREYKEITLEEIKRMFENHELEYIKGDDDKHKIRGVGM